LTIKLTQHVSALASRNPEELCNRVLQSLARSSPCAAITRQLQQETYGACGQVRLSTLRYLSKFAVLRHASLETRARNAYFLQLSKIAFRSTISDRNVSAPGGAQHLFGADAASNKKPGVERRACPSIRLGRVYSRSLPNGYARSSLFRNPVFVTNRTSYRVGRPGPSEDSPTGAGLHQHPESIANSCISSSDCNLFL